MPKPIKLKGNEYVGSVFDQLYNRFKDLSRKYRGRLSKEDHIILLKNAVQDIKIDSKGDFLREHLVNEGDHVFYAKLLLYVAAEHSLIKTDQRVQFTEVMREQYKLKRAVKARYPDGEFDQIFTYLSGLTTYGKRLIDGTTISVKNLEEWNLIAA